MEEEMTLSYLALLLAAIIFGLMTVAHLVRIFKPFKVEIGSFIVPHWASYLFFILAGYISLFLFLML